MSKTHTTVNPEPARLNTAKSPVVQVLAEHQKRLDMPDNAFARKYLGFSGSSWNLLKSGKYPADPDKLLARCEGGIRQLEDEQHAASQTGERGAILHTDQITAVLTALRGCTNEPQNRLIYFLAPTGGGKTTCGNLICEIYGTNAMKVEATESWRTSYYSALRALGRALGLKVETFKSRADAEEKIFDALRAWPRVIIIDECEYFGRDTINLVKAILNQTQCRIVMLAIPELAARMEQASWAQSQQTLRRTYARIRLVEISKRDAERFLGQRLPTWMALNGDSSRATELCRQAANRFGHYDTLERIAAEIQEQAPMLPVTLDTVASAVANVESLRR